MRCHSSLTRVLILIIPLFSVGVWVDYSNALGKGGKVSSHYGRHNSQSGPRLPTIRGTISQSKSPQLLEKGLKVPRQKSTLKRQFFQSPQPPFLSPFIYTPTTPDYSDPTTTILPEDTHVPKTFIDVTPSPAEAPHPLVFELRCGKFVRIPWPESSMEYHAVKQEEQCPDSE